MNVLVVGANGAVGQIVIVELLKSNHEVTALTRNAAAIQLKHPQLTVLQGTPTNSADLEGALAGQDAVISTLGARTNKKTTLRTDVARNLVSGMKRQDVRRLVWLDAAGVGSSKQFVQRSSFPLRENHHARLPEQHVQRWRFGRLHNREERMRMGHRPPDVIHQ